MFLFLATSQEGDSPSISRPGLAAIIRREHLPNKGHVCGIPEAEITQRENDPARYCTDISGARFLQRERWPGTRKPVSCHESMFINDV